MGIKPNPIIMEWAVERSGLTRDAIISSFPAYEEWLDGSKEPTVKQILKFANRVHVYVSDLYKDTIPNLSLRIADFRTVDDKQRSSVSPELYETVNQMMARQDWMRNYFIAENRKRVDLVGMFSGEALTKGTINRIVSFLHEELKLPENWASKFDGPAKAFRHIKDCVEQQGISVVVNGIVGDNTHRALDVAEFRGFTLSDEVAPLIFINGSDTKSAQLFTLVHELCHLTFSQTGVSNPTDENATDSVMEKFCNEVAASFLVPDASVFEIWDHNAVPNYNRIEKIAKKHCVNFIVAARKVLDLHLIDHDEFFAAYNKYKKSVPTTSRKAAGGGDYYKTKQYRLGTVFSEAIWTAVKADYISYRDAYNMTGLSSEKFARYYQEAM